MNYEYEASYLDSESDSEAWPSEYESADAYDTFESYDYADSFDAESRRRRPARPRPVKTAPKRRLAPRRAAAGGGQFVSQAAFAAAMANVERQNRVNGEAIKTVDTRVRTVIADTQKLQAQTRKTVDKLRSDLRNTQMLSALIPLIAPPTSKFGKVAPLAHLVIGSEGYPGQQGGQGGAAGPLGNTNNLIAVGALAFASGIFK